MEDIIFDKFDGIFNEEYEIESFTEKGKYYKVIRYNSDSWDCTCPFFLNTKKTCKHIRYAISRFYRNNENEVLKEWDIRSEANENIYHKVILYFDGTFSCSCQDHYYRKRDCKHITEIRSNKIRYRINDYIELILENADTKIYINDRSFIQCKYLLLNVPQEDFQTFDIVESIDEASERYDIGHETDKSLISPEVEFWGHCSNLEAWYERNYDTRLLHRNLAFPLLKRLSEVGDQIAISQFKEEIALRFESQYPSVVNYLLEEHYLDVLTSEERNTLFDRITNSRILNLIKEYYPFYNFSSLNGNRWEIESFTDSDKQYIVSYENEEWTCTCPDHRYRKRECKHIKYIQKSTI